VDNYPEISDSTLNNLTSWCSIDTQQITKSYPF